MVQILTQPVLVNVIYYRPDYRAILQEFLWETEDIVPELMRVHRFLNFWRCTIDAVIHTVEISVPDSHGWRSADWYFKGYT